MRHCFNENVELYEAEASNLAVLLEGIADWLNDNTDEYVWPNLHVSSTADDEGKPLFRAALYLHQ